MTYTEQQHQAIYAHDRSVIVVAGAGSGKTRVLVSRYLALLEQHPHWSLSELVAITFTQKAAQEMRDRVRLALQERLRDADPPAQQTWAKHLAAMDSARIDTIHALCATILRANAAEAGVDPRFAIIEPVDAEALLQDVIDRVLSQLLDALEPDPVLDLFSHYDASAVRRVLEQFANQRLPIMPGTAEDIMAMWADQWRVNATWILSVVQHEAVITEALDWVASASPLPAGDKLTAQWQEACTALQLIKAFVPSAGIGGAMDALTFLATGINLGRGSKAAWGGADELKASKVQLGAVRDWAQEVLATIGEPPGETDAIAAKLLPLWIRLIERVQAGYAAVKAADDLMDFDDLEQQTADLLARSPAVRRRYRGAEFKQVLVDEFQDTNERQWAIVKALTDPENPADDTARLFVVGDPKQSIYGFRGADVRVFEAVRALLNDVAPADTAAEIPLSRSFRTHEPLVGAYNHLFGALLAKPAAGLGADYEVEYGQHMTAHRAVSPSPHPPLELLLINTKVHDADDDASSKLDAEEARTWEAFEIATRIRQLVEEEKRPVYDKKLGETRPVCYEDIALLFQTSTSFPIYEEALRAQNIDFTTVAGRGYYGRQEVWDLLALLEALYNPDDDLSVATALRSPLFNLSDAALFALRLRGDDATRYHLWDELRRATETDDGNRHLPGEERGKVANAWRILSRLHALAGRVTISELLREALAQTGYLATLTGLPDGARRRANVEKLLKKAVESGRVTLSAFTLYLSDLSENEVREGEAATEIRNAVTLMTVHASKGLEFPLVFLPDASWKRGGGSSGILLSDEQFGVVCAVYDENGKSHNPFLYDQIVKVRQQFYLAERKRLFYVAATRAQDGLFISGRVQYVPADAAWKADGWLGQALDILDVHQVGHHETDVTLKFPWGQMRVRQPLYRLAGTTPTRIVDPDPPLWEHKRVLHGEQLPGGSAQPPLTHPVPVQKQAFARNLTATQVGDLGSAAYHSFYSERFRRSITQDAPANVRQVVVPQEQKQRVSPRILGEIVHEALRWWRFPTADDDMKALLTSYAWKHGVVQPEDLEFAVNTARGWLRDMQYTNIYRWVNKSQRIYRELPFVYQTEQRVIHGVIDVLFQREDGVWVIVDYKSSKVSGYFERNDDAAERENRRLLREHAKRYHLQVGIYAAAVERYLTDMGEQVLPEQLLIYIHYLRYVETVSVLHDEWTAALTQLEGKIGQLIESIDES